MGDNKADIKSNYAEFAWQFNLAKETLNQLDELLETAMNCPLPEQPTNWQFIHIGRSCYIEQFNPELNPCIGLTPQEINTKLWDIVSNLPD